MTTNDQLLVQNILEAVREAAQGNEPSDFMMSFGIVRDVYELYLEAFDTRRKDE